MQLTEGKVQIFEHDFGGGRWYFLLPEIEHAAV
jgi:hypothetical protein